MKRREFIGIAALGAAGVVLPTSSRGADSLIETVAQPRLLAMLRDEATVQEIGRRYREIVPREDSADVLVRTILGPQFTASHGIALREQIDDQVARDFADGRLVTLHGWILSVTEARQCALRALLTAA